MLITHYCMSGGGGDDFSLLTTLKFVFSERRHLLVLSLERDRGSGVGVRQPGAGVQQHGAAGGPGVERCILQLCF